MIEPPSWLVRISDDRNRASPGAVTLMATPEMMWSTPNDTVAMAWTNPPRAPPIMPMSRPAQPP